MVIVEHIEETRVVRLPDDEDEDKEERVLAMLGISGTVLNLLVIIFVYIYTTL
ncbi:protein TUNAR-like [Mobula hypostoma]|uniref:protein TUNAR-like n=1 Tax=Hypanus sabinus TaxID=79690 RepID=UPI0028C4B07D|nr:protein TUNAR-like [Hypanus sabinus]